MHYHIILTELCNSQCRYCYEKSLKEFDNGLDKKFKFDFSSPEKSEINVKKLKEFLQKDQNPIVIFYGGEPLLEIDKIVEIIDELEDTKVRFRMQTNGKLLNDLPFSYLKKIDKILISLDGNKERTDFQRGQGTFDLVNKNIHNLKQKGYNGEIIARMTLSKEFPDLYEQILHLLNCGFTSIHWQIDAGFYKFDFNRDEFEKFVLKYNKSLSKLVDFWVKDMQDNNRVLKLYPLLAVAESFLKKQKELLRCGAGHSGYAITTDGKVVACPIMNCIKDFEAGDLNSNPEDLKKFEIKGKCKKCNYLDLCGGRCLYWNSANLWPEEGDKLICKTIKNLIEEIKKKITIIKELINQNIISLKDFEYEKYFGPEIIP